MQLLAEMLDGAVDLLVGHIVLLLSNASLDRVWSSEQTLTITSSP